MQLRLLALFVGPLLFFHAHSAVGGEIDLPACFGENMVLQSAAQITIWGWSDYPDGEVEFDGRVIPWKGEPVLKTSKRRVRWEASIENVTNSGPAKLIVRAGEKPWLKKLTEKAKVVLTNVYVGEVWFWAAKNPPRAPQAGLPADQIGMLQERVHVFKSRLDDVPRPGTGAGKTWASCQTNRVAAGACLFLHQRATALRNVHIGLIQVPSADFLAALAMMPAGLPERNDWNNLEDAGLRSAFSFANHSALKIFNAATNRHVRAVNQLKMQGIVTNAVLVKWEDMNDFAKVRLVTLPNLYPLTVRGVIW